MPNQDVWIAYRTDANSGTGTADDPYNGSTQSLFDQHMNDLPPNARVHLGPSPRDNSNPPVVSPYLTNGSSAWVAKAGLKIIGAGMDVTVIKLVNAATGQNFMVGHALTSSAKVDGFEISDLTLDCNLPSTGSISCGAVRVMGDRVRLRRVKAINWGSKDSGTPCFVFSIISGAPDLTPPVAQGADLPGYNCPGRPVFAAVVAISATAGSLSYTQTTQVVLATTAASHGLASGDFVLLGGAGNASFDGFGGPITFISATQFSFVKNLGTTNLSSQGGVVSRVGVPIATAAGSLSYTAADKVVFVVTQVDHHLAYGDFVTMAGAGDSRFDGFWGPVDVVSSTEFFLPVLPPKDLGASDFSSAGGRLDRHVASGVSRNGSVATVSTVVPHNFFVGQIFRLQGAFVAGNENNRYKGVLTVKSVTEKSFSYDMKPGNDPDPSANANGPVLYAALWDVRRFVIENNLYDLYATDENSAIPPQGVAMFGLSVVDIPPYRFPVLIVRENVIRSAAGPVPSSANKSYGIGVTTVGGGSVESNWLDVNQPPLYYRLSGPVNHLQNRNGNNALLHPSDNLDAANPHLLDDLETQIEAATIMALL